MSTSNEEEMNTMSSPIIDTSSDALSFMVGQSERPGSGRRGLMFTNILLASDGSECALKAAAVAATLANNFSARLTLINVFEPFPTVGPYGEIVNIALDEKYIKELQEHAISHAGRIVDEMDVPYQSRQEGGQPAAEIVRVAEEEGCDLIVLGSRGLGDVLSLLLGSVCDGVLHHAHCPVLIVRGAGEAEAETLFQNILLASDGSECALKAAGAAAALASKFASHLTIINVFQPPLYIAPDGVPVTWELDDSYRGEIQDAAVCSAGRVVDAQGVTYQRRKEIGPAATEIVRVAEEEKTNLIALGSRGLSGIKAFLLGSVSDHVAHHAHCPVLIVK